MKINISSFHYYGVELNGNVHSEAIENVSIKRFIPDPYKEISERFDDAFGDFMKQLKAADRTSGKSNWQPLLSGGFRRFISKQPADGTMIFRSKTITKINLMKKYIFLAIFATASFYQPATVKAQAQVESRKDERSQKKSDKRAHKLAKRQEKLTRKESKMHKKERRANHEQRKLNKETGQ